MTVVVEIATILGTRGPLWYILRGALCVLGINFAFVALLLYFPLQIGSVARGGVIRKLALLFARLIKQFLCDLAELMNLRGLDGVTRGVDQAYRLATGATAAGLARLAVAHQGLPAGSAVKAVLGLGFSLLGSRNGGSSSTEDPADSDLEMMMDLEGVGEAPLASIVTGYLLIILTCLLIQRAPKLANFYCAYFLVTVKILSFLMIELWVLPFYIGLLVYLNVCPLVNDGSLLPGGRTGGGGETLSWLTATIGTAVPSYSLLTNFSLGAVIAQWVLGLCFLMLLALVVSKLRPLMRPGLFYFMRDPMDPDSSPIRDLALDSIPGHSLKLVKTCLMYTVITGMTLGSVTGLSRLLLGGQRPINIKFENLWSQIPTDVFVQFGLRMTLKMLDPDIVDLVLRRFLKRVTRLLKLSSFLRGRGRYPAEEGRGGRWMWANSSERSLDASTVRRRVGEANLRRPVEPIDISRMDIVEPVGNPLISSGAAGPATTPPPRPPPIGPLRTLTR